MSMITLRSDDALDVKLSEIVAELKAKGENASRSSVIREILHEKLGGTDAERRILRESLRRVHQVVRQASTLALDELKEKLPGYVDAAMEQDDEDAA